MSPHTSPAVPPVLTQGGMAPAASAAPGTQDGPSALSGDKDRSREGPAWILPHSAQVLTSWAKVYGVIQVTGWPSTSAW